ncbi:S26 family signal peptidase [Mesorhizobium sp. M00.F.Ca.ET.216.01.1.1]|uniref:S26 family signal peptidase n=1 Tax=Mesorhizobium sp. M00.F.Ca.ET.216.01.1.1 TaxID=2500528 RepID=UPI000FDAAE8A|nr:S26 family signal peptidase [Mesorhizobium sp. M00.F.Ca.ET.216.01.1.1]TGQ35760.1 S26 family signal peptidase [Mesorhizobium sp. M00.F.Ca.ET.216.01.1.1]TJW07145.1 MAG: S26 family signal peptidase [Mesorhizobium sp.]TJW35217.1 MAG: S26 family signal peptidase [Mesorhizobium sp.]
MSMRPAIIAAMLGGSILVSTPVLDHRPKFIWNASASVPIGLYRVEPADKISVADIAVVMPPEPLASFMAARGYLPHGVPLLKRVLALAGATVCRQGTAIIAYGMSFGHARERDSRDRPLPVWQRCRRIADGEVFLMNWDAADSFDSRYFGPLPLTSIIGHAVPIWTADRTSPAPNTSGVPAPGKP